MQRVGVGLAVANDFLDGQGLPPTKADRFPQTDTTHQLAASDANAWTRWLASIRAFFYGTGSAGQVLTSNGASAMPSWQNASGGGGNATLWLPAIDGNTVGLWPLNAGIYAPYDNAANPTVGILTQIDNGYGLPTAAWAGTAFSGQQVITTHGSTFSGIEPANWSMYFLVNASHIFGADNVLLGKANATNSTTWSIMFDLTTGGALSVTSTLVGGGTATASAGGGTLSTGAWHYVAATQDGTHLTLYVDGAQVAQAASGHDTDYSGHGALFVGAATATGAAPCNAMIGALWWRNVGDSGATVAANYAAMKSHNSALGLP